MSGTIRSPTACYVDETGIHAPAFTDILAYLQTQIRDIYGSDIYIANDSQDGQMLGIFALAIYDTNSMAIGVYNSYSPATAQGVGLSSVIKINGISRELPTNSTVDLLIVGVAGTTITNGLAADKNGNRWALPFVTVIPPAGQITVTAVAQIAGAVTAPANSIIRIATPVLGWQTVNNTLAAVQGAPLETDAALRSRQTTSTMLPSVTALDGMVGAVAAVPGVIRYQVYENDTNATDSRGIPSHSLAFIVDGGDAQTIAQAIAIHKTPGAGTFGTTLETIVDSYGIPHNINFFRPAVITVTVQIHLTALNGYTSAIGSSIITSVISYINSLPIGASVYLTKVISISNLSGNDSNTFNITSVVLGANKGTPAAQDITIAFNQAAFASLSTVVVGVP